VAYGSSIGSIWLTLEISAFQATLSSFSPTYDLIIILNMIGKTYGSWVLQRQGALLQKIEPKRQLLERGDTAGYCML
jgi:hypothetical protein